MARRVEGTVKCPLCHGYTVAYDGYHKANVCHKVGCSFWEQVEQPREMTKWDIIDLIEHDEDVRRALAVHMNDVMAEVNKTAKAMMDEQRKAGKSCFKCVKQDGCADFGGIVCEKYEARSCTKCVKANANCLGSGVCDRYDDGSGNG